MFEWMAWTLPSALFFVGIGVLLAVMTGWELVAPTQLRKGFLPMATTRGDRVFISLLMAAYLHIAWLALLPSAPYPVSALALVIGLVTLRWG